MFLHLHALWRRLETLFLHSSSMGVLDHELFVGALSRLPSLKNLCVSSFGPDDFDNTTLQALPALESLRLQDLRGLDDGGIVRYASSAAAQSLRRLSLVGIEIVGLSVISKLFACLRNLQRFSLVQARCPELPTGELVLQPVVASGTLEFLHWDVLSPGSANEHLAASIEAGGFPRLRTLRAPNDHDGELQAQCRPLEQVAISSDKYSFATARPQLPSEKGMRAPGRTLFAARQAAQSRLEQARTQIRFRVVVEESGVVKQVFKIPGFAGAIGSKITYSLTPDVHGSDAALIDLPDLLLENAPKEVDPRDGCTGFWNSQHPAGKKWWSHTERFRYRRVHLERFF